MNNLDSQYQGLLKSILSYGTTKTDRTETGTLSIFGYTIRHNMSEGFPLLTTKKMAWKTMVTELLWFLRGDTNIKYLVDNDCHIWDGDAYKNFLQKSDGDPDLIWNKEQFINLIKTDEKFAKEWGELGPIYGKQWRQWQGWMTTSEGSVGSIWYDQISRLIHLLKSDPDSRRMMVNAWNVGELDEMALPPCHVMSQYYVNKIGELSCHMYQRSVDVFLGLPFNIASYALLTHMLAQVCDLKVGELVISTGDTHIYSDHVEQVNEQLRREMYPQPTLWLNPDIKDINKFTMEDIKLLNYQSHDSIKAKMAV